MKHILPLPVPLLVLLLASLLFMTPSTATETGTGAGELTKKLMLTPRGETKRCPPNTDLCVIFNGKVCYDPISGTCCEDGSGFCSDGFVCGYDIAANYCCEPGRTMEECARAKSAGTATATYIPATPVPTPG